MRIRFSVRSLALTILLAPTTPAFAQTPPDEEIVAPSLPSVGEEDGDEETTELEEMKRLLLEQQARLDELEGLIEQQAKKEEEPELVKLSFHGYRDVGFFVPIGNDGVGWVRDDGNQQFPQYAGQYGWVFL